MLILSVGTAAARLANLGVTERMLRPVPHVLNTTWEPQPPVANVRRSYLTHDFLQAPFEVQVPLPQRLRLISSGEADMDHKEALKHLQTLINVASKVDDPCVVHRIFREMIGVINNAQPPQPPQSRPKTEMPYLRAVNAAGRLLVGELRAFFKNSFEQTIRSSVIHRVSGSPPTGRADEVLSMRAYGLGPRDALTCASWSCLRLQTSAPACASCWRFRPLFPPRTRRARPASGL